MRSGQCKDRQQQLEEEEEEVQGEGGGGEEDQLVLRELHVQARTALEPPHSIIGE